MTSPDTFLFRKRLEARVVQIIREKLVDKEITGDRAKEIAGIFLKMVPETISEERLLEVMPKLTSEIPEIASAILGILEERDKKLKEVVIPLLEKYFQKVSGRI